MLLSACGGGGSTAKVAKLPAIYPGRTGPIAMFTPANPELSSPNAPLDVLRALGVNTLHVGIQWATVAPNPMSPHRPSFNAADPAAYPATGWVYYDTIVRAIAARGMKLALAVIPPAPIWATGHGNRDRGTQPEWEPSASEFGQFVRAVGARYSGHYIPPGSSQPLPRVNFWSVWNEPNEGFQLGPQTVPHTQVEVSSRLYRGLLDAAWSALGATGHGHDRILIGELAPIGAAIDPGLFGAMPPLRFLRALYCVDAAYDPLRGSAATVRGCPPTAAGSAAFAAQHPALFQAFGFADHPYPQGMAPDQVTPGEPDYAELGEVGRLAVVLDALNRIYGSRTQFPIYNTEYGYQTRPPDVEALTVDPVTAAAYLNWSEYLTWLNPRLRTYDQYLLSDPAAGNFATGLQSAQGVPKPAFAAYRMPIYLPVTTTRTGHPLVVWGCVRPAHFAQLATHQPQSVQIQFAAGSGRNFKTVRSVTITSPNGYFETTQKFPGSGAVRLAWSYPHGATVASRTVDVTLR